MHFLGTLKIEFQIWKVFSFLMWNLGTFSISGLPSMLFQQKLKNCSSEMATLKMKTPKNIYKYPKNVYPLWFSPVFHDWRKLNFQCRYTVKKYKKCYFQWAGPIFKKFVFLESLGSISPKFTHTFSKSEDNVFDI